MKVFILAKDIKRARAFVKRDIVYVNRPEQLRSVHGDGCIVISCENWGEDKPLSDVHETQLLVNDLELRGAKVFNIKD